MSHDHYYFRSRSVVNKVHPNPFPLLRNGVWLRETKSESGGGGSGDVIFSTIGTLVMKSLNCDNVYFLEEL